MSSNLETLDDVEVETDLPLPQLDEIVAQRYRIVAALGRGGSSKVFEAEHVELGLRHALKFLRSERAGAARTRRRFQQEARLLAGLNHPGIARIVDIGYYRDVTPYIVLEHVAGETLRSRIRSQRPTLRQALQIMSQVCAAISSAHDKGIVHRDLKPENLMLTAGALGETLVCVLDFGIARTLAEDEPRLTPTGAQLGTPHYMAPEQARGEKHIGPPADVFALGVIFYELVAGTRPHPGDSHYSVIFHLLTLDPVPLSEAAPQTPKDVRAVIERCLNRKPEARYANAGQLHAAIDQLSAAHLSSASAPGEGRALVSSKPERRGVWLGALAGAVLGASTVSLWSSTAAKWGSQPPASPLEPVAALAPEPQPAVVQAAELNRNGSEPNAARAFAETHPSGSAAPSSSAQVSEEISVGTTTPLPGTQRRRTSGLPASRAVPTARRSEPSASSANEQVVPAKPEGSAPVWRGSVRNPYN